MISVHKNVIALLAFATTKLANATQVLVETNMAVQTAGEVKTVRFHVQTVNVDLIVKISVAHAQGPSVILLTAHAQADVKTRGPVEIVKWAVYVFPM